MPEKATVLNLLLPKISSLLDHLCQQATVAYSTTAQNELELPRWSAQLLKNNQTQIQIVGGGEGEGD